MNHGHKPGWEGRALTSDATGSRRNSDLPLFPRIQRLDVMQDNRSRADPLHLDHTPPPPQI